jgi:hypothetical protein
MHLCLSRHSAGRFAHDFMERIRDVAHVHA